MAMKLSGWAEKTKERLQNHSPWDFISRKAVIAILTLICSWVVAYTILPIYKPTITSHLDEAWQKLPSVQIDWSPNHDPRKNYNASKVALIIEPEPNPILVPLILHMMAVVPPEWRFIFIGSKKSIFSVRRAYGIQLQEALGKFEAMRLPVPWKIKSQGDRNAVLADSRFYNEFLPGVEHLLMYDTNGILCANAEKSLNDWLDFSFTGAAKPGDKNYAAHGRLSLRRVSAIQQVLTFQKRYNDSDENWLGRRVMVLPDHKITSIRDSPFAIMNNLTDERPLGYYMPDHGRGLDKEEWKKEETRKAALEWCPELNLILDMKLEKDRCEGDNHEGEILDKSRRDITGTGPGAAAARLRVAMDGTV